MLEKLEIGVVTSTHGLKGEVKVFPLTDDVDRFLDLDTVLLEARDGERELTVESVRFFKGRPILRFKEIKSIDDAQKICKLSLCVRREDAIPLGEDEYFVGDLIDSELILEDGTKYGTLQDIISTGSNDVYVVQTEDHEIVYMPAIKDCILKVDPEAQIITVRPMKEI